MSPKRRRKHIQTDLPVWEEMKILMEYWLNDRLTVLRNKGFKYPEDLDSYMVSGEIEVENEEEGNS